ncbi:MAG: ion transporter [Bacteroidota bacterium]
MIKKFFLSERNMMIAIIINALVIFLLYFPEIRDTSPNFYYFLEIIDLIFVLLFIIEAIVKIRALKPKPYFDDGWNIFDFAIVILSLPSLLHFIPGLALLNTSLLKILRLFRLIRLIRFIRFVHRIDMLLAGLARALKASIFVLLVLVFLNFMLALFTCHFYGEMAPDYFGNPLISSYHIFQMFTVEGWNEIPQVIAEAAVERDMPYASLIAGLSRFYFIIVVLIGGIFGMSLANAIFVDEMTIDNNQDLEKKIDDLQGEIRALRKLLEK